MKLIVGLGNPGRQYAHTRHNIGFIVADELGRHIGAAGWRQDAKLKAEVTFALLDGEKIMLAKPQTMMNGSGEALQAMMRFYKLELADIAVVYDDLDLPLGQVKVRTEGSSGGHQGINSIIRHIGSNFTRIRVGIDPNDRTREPSEVYVLKGFDEAQRPKLRSVIELACDVTLRSLSQAEAAKHSID